MNNYRVLIKDDPFIHTGGGYEAPYMPKSLWPAYWIHNYHGESEFVDVFKLNVWFEEDITVRIHVSADHRYILYLDGMRIGRGPERGDADNWFFETYEIPFTKGNHVMSAKVWWTAEHGGWAQTHVHPGFILAADNSKYSKMVSTGLADWKVKRVKGIGWKEAVQSYGATGGRNTINGNEYSWGIEQGLEEGWCIPVKDKQGQSAGCYFLGKDVHYMRPALLPAMKEINYPFNTAVFSELLDKEEFPNVSDAYSHIFKNVIRKRNHVTAYSNLKGMKVPKDTALRIIVDLGKYFCAYPRIILSKGKNSKIFIDWTESLINPSDHHELPNVKGQRDAIWNKCFQGEGDLFIADGNMTRAYEPLWWRSGRFIQILIITGKEELYIEDFSIAETGYPFEFAGEFQCDDQRLNHLIPISKRVLEMCSHETSMDCPYYEQLMYIGDTRLQSLVAYMWTEGEKHLAKKAVEMFAYADVNRLHLPNCAFPSSGGKIIPGFCLWWVGMVWDLAMWTEEKDLVLKCMPNVRNIMERYLSSKNEDGLILTPDGWDFVDWVDGYDWFYGEPKHSGNHVTSIFNLQMVYTLEKVKQLEVYLGEQELAQRAERTAAELMKTIDCIFWDEKEQLYTDDYTHQQKSEHAQVLAILCECLPEGRLVSLSKTITDKTEYAKTDIYYRHYLFEALQKIGRVDVFIDNLEPWFQCVKDGFTTTPEHFAEDTRSDCHAWGAHPIYHYFASVIGVRPAGMGFHKVAIRPQFAHLKECRATICHPKGVIRVEWNGKLKIDLPEGVEADIIWDGEIS